MPGAQQAVAIAQSKQYVLTHPAPILGTSQMMSSTLGLSVMEQMGPQRDPDDLEMSA